MLMGLAESSAEAPGASAHDVGALLGSSAGETVQKKGYVIPRGLSIRTKKKVVGKRVTKPGDVAKREKQRLLKAKRLIAKRMQTRKDREATTKRLENAARASARVKVKKVAAAQAQDEAAAVKREQAAREFARAKRDPDRSAFKAKGFKAAQEMKKATKAFNVAMRKAAKRKAALARMKQEEKQHKARTVQRRKKADKASKTAAKRIVVAEESRGKAKQAKKLLRRAQRKKAVKTAVADEARVKRTRKRTRKMRQEARKSLQKKDHISKKAKAAQPPVKKASSQSTCAGCLARCSRKNASCKTWCQAHWCVRQLVEQVDDREYASLGFGH